MDPGEFAKQLMATAERESKFLTICSTAPSYLMCRAHSGVQGMKVRTIPFANMFFMNGGQPIIKTKLNKFLIWEVIHNILVCHNGLFADCHVSCQSLQRHMPYCQHASRAE